MLGFPGSSAGKESTCNAGDPDSIPGLGRCAREEIGFTPVFLGFCNGSDGIESAYNAGDPSLISGLGRSPGEGNGNLPQYSCLDNSMDGEAWQVVVHGVTKSWTQLSN